MIRTWVLLVGVVFVTACKKEKNTNAPTPSATNDTSKTDTRTAANPLTSIKLPVESGEQDSFITYLIKKDNNYCENNTYAVTSYAYLHFRCSFDSSGIYTTDTPSNQQDINKLYGFADCSSFHQTNSARFGWNWDNGAMHIHAYCYSNSVVAYKELGTVNLKETFDCQLTVLPNKYIFTLNGKSDTMTRGCAGANAAGYKLLPYFGGNETAPHDVRIRIREMQ